MNKKGYLRNGEEVLIHQKVEDGYIIEKYITVYLEYDEEEDLSGEKVFVSEVFNKPPTNVKEKSLADLDIRIKSKTNVLNALSSEELSLKDSIRKRGLEIEEMDKNAKKYKAIEGAIDFIEGKFTHFAIIPSWGKPYVATKNEGMDAEGKYDRGTKLLTLFGKTEGDLEWRINQYSDGSGSSNQLAQPCKSEQEAIDFIKTFIIKQMGKYVKDDKKRDYSSDKYKWMLSNNFDMPEGFDEKNSEYMRKQYLLSVESIEGRIKKEKENLSNYKKKLRELK